MANTVSSLKRVRQTERKTAVNRLRKSRLRTQIRKLRRLVATNDANGAQTELSETRSHSELSKLQPAPNLTRN